MTRRDDTDVGMLKRAKVGLLQAAGVSGVMRATARSGWRRKRLIILCYHGVSLDDEHLWNPQLYVSPQVFRRRLEILRRGGYEVMPLEEATTALYDGTLPDRAVVLTFDDGHYDFKPVALPMIEERGFPVTTYLTTYHTDCNIPIYSLVCSYMLWKGRSGSIDLGPISGGSKVELRSKAARDTVLAELNRFAIERELSAMDKHAVARRVAESVGIDFDGLCERRVLHLLNPAEVSELAAKGVDFQMHTHCHRSPRVESEYREQVRRNRMRIEELTGQRPTHFCYPSGETAPEFNGWLAAEQVETAVTCERDLASSGSAPLELPRLLDHMGMPEIEFESWLSGFSSFLPSRG